RQAGARGHRQAARTGLRQGALGTGQGRVDLAGDADRGARSSEALRRPRDRALGRVRLEAGRAGPEGRRQALTGPLLLSLALSLSSRALAAGRFDAADQAFKERKDPARALEALRLY